jgi:acyl-CoA reductase-like NAD-dependent aldehyde dehydrogenase
MPPPSSSLPNLRSNGPEPLELFSPAGGAKIAELAISTTEDIARVVARGRAAQRIWEEQSFAQRAAALYRYRDLLLDHKETLADLLVRETGKPRSEAYGQELFYVCDAIGFWAGKAARHLKPQKIRPHLLKTKKLVSLHAPVGVVGIIGPWNFPLVLTIGEAIPALMAGNAVVIKPSELTPLAVLHAVELAQEAGFPEGLLQAVVGRGEAGEALVDHADMISFTGSTETGRKVLRRAAERLIPVTLELGGKDPMIVLRDADLERAANACVWGALMNSGQVCTSIERVYVEAPVYESFVAKVVEKVRRLRQGPSDDEVELGSMTSRAQVEKVEAQVEDAVRKGARILTGGRRAPGLSGLYYEPTVLAGVTHEMEIMREETFGPVIPIMKVQDADEALRMANDSRYGLDASVFSGNKKTGWSMARKIQAGSVCINDGLVNFIIPDAPMGGVKDSGLGLRHGAEGIRKYCRQKTILIDRLGLKSEFVWFPASRKKTALFRRGLDLLFRSGWKKKLFPPRHKESQD